MDNRGWLRIVEASVAVMIVLSILFFIYLNKPVVSGEADLSQFARDVLSEVASNVTLRGDILRRDTEALNSSVANYIQGRYDFEVIICDVGSACGQLVFRETEVYAAERVVSTNLVSESGELKSKKIRLFMWRKSQ